MLPKRPRRQDADTLTWEYLDGDISPTRAEQLSKMLAERAAVRQQFVESAVMHGMLHEYFKNEQTYRVTSDQGDVEYARPKRRKSRRSSAA